MECKEIRVDMRIPNPEGSKEMMRANQVMFKLNHTLPFTDEYNELLKELFGDNLGEGSYVAAPISGSCVSSMKNIKPLTIASVSSKFYVLSLCVSSGFQRSKAQMLRSPANTNAKVWLNL